VVDWNLEWFPGGKPDAPPEEQAAQMAAAKKAILNFSQTLSCFRKCATGRLSVKLSDQFLPWRSMW
jgi:hypothetical protein